MNTFKELNYKEKARVIKLMVGMGFRSLLDIELFYDRYQLEYGGGPGRPEVVKRLDRSNADFAKRMREPRKRMTIRDWVNKSDYATHKMSWAEDDVSPYIYPDVLRHGNYLKDYSDPRYSYQDAARQAMLSGDYMRVLNPEEAEWVTTHYKDYYPGFQDPLVRANIGPEYNLRDINAWAMTASPWYGIEYTPDDDLLDYRDIRNKQLYLESAGKVNAKSNKGAQGIFQIMPGTAKWYQDSTGDIGDVNDPVYNERMRDWVMERNWENDVVKQGNPSKKTRMKKALAAYNYGAGNLQNALNKALKAGVDIINGDEWINYLPNETRNYVNFIMNGMDASEHKTQEKYQEWLGSGNKYIATDPNVYKKGGSIHIKPENRGKFNATKKRTGKSTEELTHSKNPLTRKRAIFALNMAKIRRKHEYGGFIQGMEYDLDPIDIQQLINLGYEIEYI